LILILLVRNGEHRSATNQISNQIILANSQTHRYLDINPRGLVPAIKYSVPGIMDEEIIYESHIVAQFLADSFPSHLLPASKESPTSALRRARIDFFVDTWNTKVASHMMPTLVATTDEEKEAKVNDWVAAVEKELEPLLKDANPFFGGSKELTFAEVIAAPFLVRWFSVSEDGEVISKTLAEKLNKLPNFAKWAKAVRERKSVLTIYDEKAVVEGTKSRIERMRARHAGK
jgi:glutathione S-transferase